MIDGIAWPEVRVSSLYAGRLGRDLAAWRPTHIVSLIDPDLEDHRRPVLPPGVAAIQRPFWDVDQPGALTADRAMIDDVLAFLRDWRAAGPDTRLLSHCHMGVSRSTAAAYVALALVAGPGREADAFARLLAVTNKPWPNRLVTLLADDALERRGALVAQVDAYRAANQSRLRAYIRLNRRRGFY